MGIHPPVLYIYLPIWAKPCIVEVARYSLRVFLKFDLISWPSGRLRLLGICMILTCSRFLGDWFTLGSNKRERGGKRRGYNVIWLVEFYPKVIEPEGAKKCKSFFICADLQKKKKFTVHSKNHSKILPHACGLWWILSWYLRTGQSFFYQLWILLSVFFCFFSNIVLQLSFFQIQHLCFSHVSYWEI